MTKKDSCDYIWKEQEKLHERKNALLREMFELDEKLDTLDHLASHFVCEDLTPEGRMANKALAGEVKKEMYGVGVIDDRQTSGTGNIDIKDITR